MYVFRILLSLSILLAFNLKTKAQIKDSVLGGALLHVHGGGYVPGGDLADRFGSALTVGGGVMGKFRNNIFFGVDANFFFGNKVKEDTILDNISSNGFLIGSLGNLTIPVFQQRGFTLTFQAGKLFNWIGPNPNSGILMLGGLGFMQHRIRIEYLQNEAGNLVPALEGDYVKGYDRLSNGLSTMQFIGYLNSSNNRLINYYVGLDLYQGFTKNRRDLNIDAGLKDEKNRLDLQFGLKFGWFFGIYKQHRGQTFYF